jgi:hypothetical protein
VLSSPLSPHKTICGLLSSPLTPHRTSGSLKPSLLTLTSPYHTNSASLSCALALSFSSPTRADTTPAKTKKQCQGMYSGSNCEVLNEVAKMMENNAQRLQSIAESEDPITCFATSDIGTDPNLLPNQNGTFVSPWLSFVPRIAQCLFEQS